MLSRLADRLVLCPSTGPVEAEGKELQRLEYEAGALELWIHRRRVRGDNNAELFVLKLGGAGSRAERQTLHPLDFWDDVNAELWCLNPPGYGGSAGRPSLQHLAPTAAFVYRILQRVADGRPVIVAGNSLGTAPALHLAATQSGVSGLILRNPPPLSRLIVGRHGWWNLWLGAWLVARQIPRELDSPANAAAAQCPAVFFMSSRDRIVPPPYQQLIQAAYAGSKQIFIADGADHAALLSDHQAGEYGRCLAWLRERTFAPQPDGKPL